MELQEEEMLRKERENQRDLEDTIGLVNFISKRDLVNRGRSVTPSGKQWKEVQSIAATLRISKRSKKASASASSASASASSAVLLDSYDMDMSSSVSEFDLLSKGKSFVCESVCVWYTIYMCTLPYSLTHYLLINSLTHSLTYSLLCRSPARAQWSSEQARPGWHPVEDLTQAPLRVQ